MCHAFSHFRTHTQPWIWCRAIASCIASRRRTKSRLPVSISYINLHPCVLHHLDGGPVSLLHMQNTFRHTHTHTILIKSTLPYFFSHSLSLSQCGAFDAGANVLGYIPFYVLYYMLMALHTQFAQSALGIGRRFRRLNNALQLAFPIGNTFWGGETFLRRALGGANYSKASAVPKCSVVEYI